jgi:hypothetical protein
MTNGADGIPWRSRPATACVGGGLGLVGARLRPLEMRISRCAEGSGDVFIAAGHGGTK